MPPSEKPYKLGFTIGHYAPALKTKVAKFNKEDENSEKLVS